MGMPGARRLFLAALRWCLRSSCWALTGRSEPAGETAGAPLMQQGGCEFTPFAQWQLFGLRGEHLNTNVVRAGRLVRADSITDAVQIAPCDDGVDQPVASPIPEIAFVKPELQKIIGVVGQREIEAKKRSSDLPRLVRIGFEHDCLLGTQVTVGA